MIMYKGFVDCITPLLCEAGCGSPTYGIRTVGLFGPTIKCGGCGRVQSVEYAKYLDSPEYAKDFLIYIEQSNDGYYEEYKKHFVGKQEQDITN